MNSLSERNKFVEENIGLVYMVAKKFLGRGVDFEDIVQIGSVGLIKAGERFNPELNVKFSTYAVTMIIGEIKRFFRDDGLMKIPRNVKEIGLKIAKATDELRKKTEHEPTIKELSDYMNVDAEKIVEAIEAMRPCKSLYVENDDGDEVFITIADSSDISVKIEEELFLKEIIGSLDVRLRQIIIFRFFKDKTQSEVARILKISQVQVSRLEKRALEIMKNRSKFTF